MALVRVALAQMDVVLGNKDANLEKAASLVSQAASKGAKVVCLPELFTTGFIKEKLMPLAETTPGPTTTKLQEIAAKHDILIAGSMAENGDGKLYNTAVIVGKDGLVSKYRKVHPFLEEAKYVTSGSSYGSFDTDFAKCGLLVCYDAAFPESARSVSIAGAQIVFVPSNWMDPFMSQWQLATSARALDNQMWVVAVNRIGNDGTFNYFGHSRIIDPFGNTLVELGNGEELVVADIETETAGQFKGIVNFMADRKPGTYQALATKTT